MIVPPLNITFVFQKFWKLSVILLLLESYSNFILNNKESHGSYLNETVSHSFNEEIYLDDLRFYKEVLRVLFQTSGFVVFMYLFTRIYSFFNKKPNIPLFLIWKTVTLSNCSIFLILPALIWDIHAYNSHYYFILIYSTLSQLIIYKGKFTLYIFKHQD